MEIVFGIISVLALVFCIIIVLDRALFMYKIKKIKNGMTGRQIENETNLRLRIFKIEGNSYNAQVISMLTIFKYRLTFFEGKLISKVRE